MKINTYLVQVTLLVILLFASALPSQAAEGRRVALVIGNENYDQLGTLLNAAADATSIAEKLRELGYVTTVAKETSEQRLRKVIRLFASESAGASMAVVFYAGHGAQVAVEGAR